MWNRTQNIIKSSKIFFLKNSIINYVLLLIFSVFKINNRKIIVINFWGKWYWGMGKYICKELVKYDYKIFWAAKKEYVKSLPKGINYVEFGTIKYLYHLATAKVWINNSRFWYGTRKRKDQFYIQTWHGWIAMKKVESAAENELSKEYVLSAKNDSKMANLFVSNSTYCTNRYKKYFWYNGDILEEWSPKNDIIINNSQWLINKIKNCLWISKDCKICLYAPTFRAKNSLDVYNINYKNLIKALNNKFGGDWILLIRLHPNISYLANQINIFSEKIINVTNYPDMQELLVISDFLITDYSSCIFDFTLKWKPALIYASDVEEYKKDRDFEIKIEDTPFPIATNNVELNDIIQNYDINKYKNKLKIFYNKIGLKETGKSSQKIAKIINKITKVK